MDNKFKILNAKEEQKLSSAELKEYYQKLREYLKSRKLTNTTPGATTIAPKLKNFTNKVCEIVISAFSSKNVEKVCDGLENIPDEPVIFAHTHQNLLDGFVWIPQLDRHVIVLHHQDVRKILLLCQFNTGLVLIKKDDKVNAANAKLDMMSLLLRGHSIAWFPEGTYCLSPNKFHLPLKYGIIDAAKKTGVPIIPVAHDFVYDYSGKKAVITKIQSKYGKPIYVRKEDNLSEKLREYEESISTLKYELIEAKGIFNRNEITNFEYINFLKELYKTIDFSNVDKVKERELIYKANDEFYKFYHLNDIPFTEEGELLDTEEVRRLIAIGNEQELKRISQMINDLRSQEQIKQHQFLTKKLAK